MHRSIEVWKIHLAVSTQCHQRLLEYLSDAERTIAGRFQLPVDRYRYELCHAAVREILAMRLNTTPIKLRFETNMSGKPFLAGREAAVQFNLSHSHDLAVLAVTTAAAVGIDIEYCRPLPEWASLSRRVCTPGERALLASNGDAQTLFYHCWTGKEAVLKCLGVGLAYSPHAFEVLDEGAELRSQVDLHRIETQHKEVLALQGLNNLPDGYLGALALQAITDQELRIDWHDWRTD